MKAPKSWILEYVDVPDGTSTDELPARLTLTGLKLEAIESAGAGISSLADASTMAMPDITCST